MSAVDWKILIADGLSENGLSILRSAAIVEDRPNISGEELLQHVGEVDALIVRSRTKVNASVFRAARRLKVVGRAGVGVDNIDLDAAKSHRVTVVNAPQSTSQAVAEHTLALILALARQLPHADASMKAGLWIKKELEGIELRGKTIGIIGLGNIGRLVAGYCAVLGMNPIGFDARPSPDQIRERGVLLVSLDDLFAQADFISIHTPLTAETRGLINSQSLARMKSGVRLICTARGGIIEEEALLHALESGQVAGAALDVFAQEPPGATPLVAHPKVIATPHIAAQTEEAQARAAADIADEVLAALRGNSLRWKVV